MRIEKKYYDLYAAEWNEITKEIHQKQNALTEAERELEKKKTSAELQEIYRRYEEYTRNWKRIPDENRIQMFQKLSAQTLWLAEQISCNIVVENEKDTFGKIVLEAECYTLASSGDRSFNKVFSNLFLTADDVFIGETPDKLCKMEFWFHLYEEIPIRSTEKKTSCTL